MGVELGSCWWVFLCLRVGCVYRMKMLLSGGWLGVKLRSCWWVILCLSVGCVYRMLLVNAEDG